MGEQEIQNEIGMLEYERERLVQSIESNPFGSSSENYKLTDVIDRLSEYRFMLQSLKIEKISEDIEMIKNKLDI